MAGTDATIKIKLGQIEVEYQGDASFLKQSLVEIIKELIELQQKYPAFIAPPVSAENPAASKVNGKYDHSTDTVANLLGVGSGGDLIIAAAVHLHFTKKKDKFSRQEIAAEMRTAPSHFKESYLANLSKYLTQLTKDDRLRLVAPHTYALSAKEKSKIEAALAEAS
jgi:hypothetical protein